MDLITFLTVINGPFATGSSDVTILTKTVTITDYTQLSGADLTIETTFNGDIQSVSLFDPSEWQAAVSNNATASSLNDAINLATIDGISSTVLANVITITASASNSTLDVSPAHAGWTIA